MEDFGWSLQSRQEVHQVDQAVVHEAVFSRYHAVVVPEIQSYSTLHFARSLCLLHMAELRSLQTEFDALQWPEPRTLRGPGCLVTLMLMCAMGVLVYMWGPHWREYLGPLAVLVFAFGIYFYWLRRRMVANEEADAICEQSHTQGLQLREAARNLLDLDCPVEF